MKSFQEYVNEAYKPGELEIPTTKAKEHKLALQNLGIEVKTADLDGLVVVTKTKSQLDKLHKWMFKNGWDKEDLKALHS